MNIYDVVDVFYRNPGLFQFRNVTIHSTDTYLGIYFHILSNAGLRVSCHITLAHWPLQVRPFSPSQLTRLSSHAQLLLNMTPEFAFVPIVDLGRRCLTEIHVQSSLSRFLWSLFSMALSFLGCPAPRRDGFHMSFDSVLP